MASQCCISGFQWDGTPTGIEGTLADNKSYIAGSNADVAVMVIHDMFGWTFVNERLLCDDYAKEIGATVYMPDFFGGEVVDPAICRDQKRWGEFDFQGMLERNSKAIREPEIFACARALKSQYKRVGVIGFCYGGWGSFRCGATSHEPHLVDCISTAHPGLQTKEEIENLGVPTQIIAPEVDPTFTPEFKKYANEVIPTKGIPYDYQYFPGVEHSFATRGNPDDEKERLAMVRAKRAQVFWMKEWLHGDGKW